MRRLKEQGADRGASIVLVAISMVVLVGFTALAVDVGLMWSDRKQLQNGADAGALAIAQSCANAMDETVNCDTSADLRSGLETLAAPYAPDNKIDNNATVAEVDWTTPGQVTVTTASTRDLLFAAVLGSDEADLEEAATAAWDIKSGGQFLPLTFSKCAFEQATGTASGLPASGESQKVVIYLKNQPGGGPAEKPATGGDAEAVPAPECPEPLGAGNGIPGGFGWLEADDAACLTAVSVGNNVASDTGGNNECLDLATLRGPDGQGAIVQIPIFETCTSGGVPSTTSCDGGANGEYQIYALAAFHVTAYCLPRSPEFSGIGSNNEWWSAPGGNITGGDVACSSGPPPSGHRLIGYFLGYADAGDGETSTPSPPNYGLGLAHLVD